VVDISSPWHSIPLSAVDERTRCEYGLLPGKTEKHWYCFGQSFLRMECEDHAFSRRFRDIYGECAVQPTEPMTAPHVEFRVAALQSNPSLLEVSIIPNPSDGADFMRRLVPERRYMECKEAATGWKMLALPDAPEEPVFAFGPSDILVSRSHPWQNAIALYAISSAFRLQPDVYVLHAGSVAISGNGVLFSGAKGAGKSTLSLCFASRGHSFLGDEWAAVSCLTGELLPLRRAASIRPGPQATGVEEYIQSHPCDTETLPDGTRRVRAKVGKVFPRAVPHVVPLTDIFFLRRFASRPLVERFTAGKGELPPISPLLASVWGYPPAERALQLFRTLGKARWWHLDVGGSPEETAGLIEETLKEGSWD
jgi:hypothetical protein